MTNETDTTTADIINMLDNPPTVADMVNAGRVTRTRRNMDHSNCTHAATTDARTDCRESAKLAGTWPLPAPVVVSTPDPVHCTIGRGKTIHNCVGVDLAPACGVAGIRNGTDDAVTCKNCLKMA
jgi:hypothetical protein